MEHWKTFLTALVAVNGFAGEQVITCEPRELRGVPGEPLQVEITIKTDRAAPAQLRIPHIDNLHLHTIEKIPIQRTKTGCYVQKRIIIWQGLEAGSVTLTNLTVSFRNVEELGADFPTSGKEAGALTQSVPDIGIIIDEVVPAKPPVKEDGK